MIFRYVKIPVFVTMLHKETCKFICFVAPVLNTQIHYLFLNFF